jgi:hypothetical protein
VLGDHAGSAAGRAVERDERYELNLYISGRDEDLLP